MGHIGKKSGNKRSRHKRFLMLCILLGIIVQISVTIYPSTALAVPRVNCVNTTPSNNGTSAPPAPATPGIVVINEVLPTAASQWNCTTPDSQENAWIEIYNPQNQPLDLYAARASVDEGSGIHLHYLPFGSIVAAHGFLVIFPFPDFTSPFSLVRLLISQVVVDQVSTPSLAPDTSYARIPDGSNNWQITTAPTIASSNTLNTITPTVKATKTASQATKAEKTKSAISTATQTTKSKSTKTQGNGTSNNANDGATTNIASPGVQPTWSALSLPQSHANDAVSNNSARQSSSSSSISSVPPANSPTLPDKILLTSLTVAFIAALLACWRLYRWYKSIRP